MMEPGPAEPSIVVREGAMPNEPTEKDPNDTSDKPPFRESAEVLLAMWRTGEYPNPSDAVQDCKALLYAVPPEHASYRPQLEAILEEAVLRAAELAAARAAMPDPPSVPRMTPQRPPVAVRKAAPPAPAKKAAPKKPAAKAAAKKAPAKKAPAKKAPPKKAKAAKKKPAKPPAKKAKGKAPKKSK
jgi:hypothetical protein